MEEVKTLLTDPKVQAYFLILGLSIHQCTKIYFSNTNKTSTNLKTRTDHPTKTPSILPPILSILIIGITWFLILRFILLHANTSSSYFDDAYKDVLRAGHYFTSTQLLSWAIVAVCWVASSRCDGDYWDGVFLLFGFLGAMGAAFVMWVPCLYTRSSNRKGNQPVATVRGKGVPITYLLTSSIAFVCIWMLKPCDPSNGECTLEEGFGTFHVGFRQWLQCLHVILVLPIVASFLLPKRCLPCMPSSLLFGALAAVSAAWHIYQVKIDGAKYKIPWTDCQLSITTDLICCSWITLYAIYNDTKHASWGEEKDAGFTAFRKMCLSAVMMPLVSPAAVLAGHLCMHNFGEIYSSFIAGMQQRVASKLRSEDSDKNWCNLGLWNTPDCSYDQACENLAFALGKIANLNSSDAVLSCGCGLIDEVRYFKQQFQLRHVTGIDLHLPEARTTDVDDYNIRTIRANVDDVQSLFPPQLFNKIIALDNVYHYRSKKSFFCDCFKMLPDDGQVSVSDIVLKRNIKDTPVWVKIVLCMMGVTTNDLWSEHEYVNNLDMLGYDKTNIDVKLVGADVFKGWSIMPACLVQYLDYALIAATKKSQATDVEKKKRVAIVGSGLAGLSTAYYLLSSKDAASFEVDIYEANPDAPGLAGNTHLIGEQLVDVPARMACLGYYNQYKQLLHKLNIPSTVVRTDSSFYGDDGNGSKICYSYEQNSLLNICNAFRCGGAKRLFKMIKALSKLRTENDMQGGKTFGEWLQVNLDLSQEKTYQCESTGILKEHDLPSLTCHDNPFVYIMVGALSWMLSCTWADLLKYPADIVLPYCRGLKMDRLGSGRRGQVVRIVPSIKILERTLLYGVNSLNLGSRVFSVDDDKVINGIAYDAVVIATEAKAVPKVVKNSSDVFKKVAYHPSAIYLHTDESFMPPDKKDWKCWNVDMSSGRPEPQLTFWLNEFYPNSNFDTNVFQTWAPSHTPNEATIIKRSDFERVVHSKETRSYVDAIKHIQGKNGFYYAGSYCVYGMGLLEEALISGRTASDKILIGCSESKHPKQSTLNALVIGCGPSGLCAAKYLTKSVEPFYDVTIVESSNSIGGSFTNKVYDNCRLVSSKYLTAFSDFRMPEDTSLIPDHPSTEQYVDYLEQYANEFDLNKLIKFGCRVVSIKDARESLVKGDDVGYDVEYTSAAGQVVSEHYDVIAVCSGLHNVPYIPPLFHYNESFATKFKGTIIHSSQYKYSSTFDNKRVLILGCGETAMDLAHRAVLNPSTKSVALSARRGFLSIPHNLAKDRPLDVFITNLFEHAYEHPWVHALRLRWIMSTFFIRLFLFLTGSSWGFNQWAMATTPIRRGYHIINKSHSAMSHLNVPFKKMSYWGKLWLWIYGEQNLRPIESFHLVQVTGVDDDGVTVRFCDGRTYQADLVVLATGYKQSFPFLHTSIRDEFARESLEVDDRSSIESTFKLDEDVLPSKHFIVSKSRPRLGFIGFVRPNVGAIPVMSELQVMWWLENMRGRVQMMDRAGPRSYMVLGRKYSYGVDYGNYMHRLAEDFGAAPTLRRLAGSKSPVKALFTYCIGQSMISLFRLEGPYESEECYEVVVGELWRVCIKRGWAENIGLLFMTLLSLLMNLTACLVELIWCVISFREPKFFARYG